MNPATHGRTVSKSLVIQNITSVVTPEEFVNVVLDIPYSHFLKLCRILLNRKHRGFQSLVLNYVLSKSECYKNYLMFY